MNGGEEALELLNFISYCHSEYIPNKLLIQYLYNTIDNEGKALLEQALIINQKHSRHKSIQTADSLHTLSEIY